jgi:hypothetical protein
LDMVREILKAGPITADELLVHMAQLLEMPLVTSIQYVLSRTLTYAFLKYLQELQEAEFYFYESRWLWQLSEKH